MKEGIELHIECLAKDGEEVPVDHPENQILATTKVELPAKLKISFA